MKIILKGLTVADTHCYGLIYIVEMEQRTFKNVNSCLNTNIYSYLETSGGQSSNLYLNVVHFFQH